MKKLKGHRICDELRRKRVICHLLKKQGARLRENNTSAPSRNEVEMLPQPYNAHKKAGFLLREDVVAHQYCAEVSLGMAMHV